MSEQQATRTNRILIVEDDDISQFLINKMMTDLGYHTYIVSNGIEALEVLETEKFDLILMDIEMPIISGFETTRRIRNSNITEMSQIPIIGISANPLENDAEPFIEKGMNDYISKPIHELELKKKLDKQLLK
jgi:CheY-like chemotaxis protein